MSIKMICDFCGDETEQNYYNNTCRFFTGRSPKRFPNKHLAIEVHVPKFVANFKYEHWHNERLVEERELNHYPSAPFDFIICEKCIMLELKDMIDTFFSNKYAKGKNENLNG